MLRTVTLAVLLATVPLVGSVGETGPAAVEVRVAGIEDTVELQPHDPRAPSLAERAPEAADGLSIGTLDETGHTLHLVQTEEGSLGLLSLDERLVWVTLDQGTIVPAELDPPARLEGPDALDGDAREADDATKTTQAVGTVDDTVQILLDADQEYWFANRFDWDDHQLRVMHLVSAIYEHQVGISFEVIEQKVTGQFDDRRFFQEDICEPEFDLLNEFTQHWEEQRPTTQNPRELAHLFTGKDLQSGGTIGCAWIKELNTDHAYGVSTVTGIAGIDRDVQLVAHEIGHNFFGLHSRAIPTPGGPLDQAACTQPTSVMFPCVGGSTLVFSNTTGAEEDVSADLGVAQDGGNLQHMRAYASGRV